MRYLTVRDAREELRISKLTLGSIYFGSRIEDDESFWMIEEFLAGGGTMIDTARCYANWIPNGEGASERAIGRWLKHSPKRHQVLVGTKGGNTKAGVNPYRADLSKEGLTGELEESLRCLGTDYVDLYWLHRDDPRLPVEEIVELADGFVRQGKVRMLGVSNWGEERLTAANQYAKDNNLHPFVMNQVQFSLAECTKEEWGDPTVICMNQEREDWYAGCGIPLAAFTSQGQGFYTKVMEGGVKGLSRELREKFYHGENIKRIERIKHLSEVTGYTASQIVLGYLECHPVETTALIGSRTRIQLADSLMAADVELTKEQIRYLRDGKM